MASSTTVNERLRPRWTHPRFFGLIGLRKAIEQVISKYLPVKTENTIIDLGCGSMPYRSLLEPCVKKYLGADIAINPNADLLIDEISGKVNIGSGTADIVMSTQVLEHVTSPVNYLAEAHRICVDNGLLIISTHGFWLYHPDPNDYWRWTASGLRKVLKDNGWKVEYSVGILGFAAASLCLFQDAIVVKIPKIIRKPFWVMMQMIVGMFDSFYSPSGRLENAALYLIVARKINNENINN